MAAKIAAAVLTLLLTIAISVAVFVFMLVAMNGFSERDATWGIAAYAVLVVIVGLLSTGAATVLAGRFARRQMHGAIAVSLAVVVCSLIAAGLVAASGFAGVIVADVVRRNR
jgi:hypothetical protein